MNENEGAVIVRRTRETVEALERAGFDRQDVIAAITGYCLAEAVLLAQGPALAGVLRRTADRIERGELDREAMQAADLASTPAAGRA